MSVTRRSYHLAHNESERSIVFIMDSILSPRTKVRGAPVFIKASRSPSCGWRLKWYSDGQSQVCPAILELSLHPSWDVPVSILRDRILTLWGLW